MDIHLRIGRAGLDALKRGLGTSLERIRGDSLIGFQPPNASFKRQVLDRRILEAGLDGSWLQIPRFNS